MQNLQTAMTNLFEAKTTVELIVVRSPKNQNLKWARQNLAHPLDSSGRKIDYDLELPYNWKKFVRPKSKIVHGSWIQDSYLSIFLVAPNGHKIISNKDLIRWCIEHPEFQRDPDLTHFDDETIKML